MLPKSTGWIERHSSLIPEDCGSPQHTEVATWERSTSHNRVPTEKNSGESDIWLSALHNEEPGPVSIPELFGQRYWLPLTKCTKAWCTKLPNASLFLYNPLQLGITFKAPFTDGSLPRKISSCVGKLQEKLDSFALSSMVATNNRLTLEMWLVQTEMCCKFKLNAIFQRYVILIKYWNIWHFKSIKLS